MDTRLDGRIALVTGGAGTIGVAVATALARAGCTVYLGDVRLEAALDCAEALGDAARAIALDVSDARQAVEAVRRIEVEAGGLDILVTNAGVITAGTATAASFEDWDAACAVNLSGVYYCAKAAWPALMRRGRGRIIHIAATGAASGIGPAGNVFASAAQAGVCALTRGLARELAAHNITVNAIAPPGLTAAARTAHPSSRAITAQDVANVAAFLASDAAACITGETLLADGAAPER
jgi:NAD(P)-dependent dehydrogenase (short-subunit alcohol dehydrogenase family)